MLIQHILSRNITLEFTGHALSDFFLPTSKEKGGLQHVETTIQGISCIKADLIEDEFSKWLIESKRQKDSFSKLSN
jgi:glutamine synthetase type III